MLFSSVACRALAVAAAALFLSGCADDGSVVDTAGGTAGTMGPTLPNTESADDGVDDTAGEATVGQSGGADTSTVGSSTTGGSATMGDDTSIDDTGSTDGTATDGTTGPGSGSDGGVPCDDDADCDDLQFCNGLETCGGGGFCLGAIAPDCADAVACTVDACDEIADACISVADDGACDNMLFCDGPETCDPLMGCQDGVAPACDDGVGCTDDACDDMVGACVFSPNDGSCQDTEFCNGAEVCDVVMDCQPALAGPDCDDLTACTADSCDEVGDSCVNAANNALCDNGLFCDGEEQCFTGMGCLPGIAPDCGDDMIDCTVELCDEMADQCDVSLDNTVCAMVGLDFCTDAGCVAGQQCANDTECDDGIGCNGVETCDLSSMPGVCQAGIAVSCNDSVVCTIDACVELGGNATTCDNAPSDPSCDDGNPCNGEETCDAAAGCLGGPAPDCDDGISCTNDFCLPAAGCVSPPDDFLCDDGLVCNGAEVCDVVLDCQPSATGLLCPDDGFSCTVEVCDETVGGCITTFEDSVCDCGLHCDPAAPGVDADGCTDDCSIALCDGTLWQCGNCIDDDGDCDVDGGDQDCFGVCDNNEAGFDGDIPGQNSAPCKADCYFDDDSGSGTDDCFWSHSCDPLDPEPYDCQCEPEPAEMFCDANIPGYQGSCDEAWATQSQECLDVCGPVVPNGCDCFGCCEVSLTDMTTRFIYLGSEEPENNPSCNIDVVADPLLCKECTQVQGCLNTCEPCELCFGETELPPECGGTPECEGEIQPCGVPGLPSCSPGQFCLTGCCTSF